MRVPALAAAPGKGSSKAIRKIGVGSVTVFRKGMVDHSDSMGAAGRYGGGDVQWMTAGAGIQHSEMFPLLQRGGANTVELFQIWLNLPSARKMTAPHFKMLWREDIRQYRAKDTAGRSIEATLIAGELGGVHSPKPPPASWAADPMNPSTPGKKAASPGMPTARKRSDRAEIQRPR